MIRVLVVEDSPTVRELLVHILTSDPEIQVVGTAVDGGEAVQAVELYRPNVITMDIHMPTMDGFEATRRIMETRPTPIVIISGNRDVHEVEVAFQAMAAGALTLLERPRGFGHAEYEKTARACIQAVKLMSEVKVVKRWARPWREPSPAADRQASSLPQAASNIRLIAIGASTGGPNTIQTILAGLRKPAPVPIVIVQHMAPGFIHGLADWLTQSCGLPVHVAAQGERMIAGHTYLAPDQQHMGVTRDGCIVLNEKCAGDIVCPSVSFLFRSLVEAYGEQAVGVLLTGMGRDGAAELKQMKARGAVTIAQDGETAIVNGMPGEACRIGAATYVLAPPAIAATLTRLLGQG